MSDPVPHVWYTWDRETRQMVPCGEPSMPRDEAAIAEREIRAEAMRLPERRQERRLRVVGR